MSETTRLMMMIVRVGVDLAKNPIQGWASLALGPNLFFCFYFDTVAEVERSCTVHVLSTYISRNGGCSDERWTQVAELRGTTLGSLCYDSKTLRLCKIEALL